MLEDHALLRNEFKTFKPSVVVHLAAQAGVRYSLKNPKAYILLLLDVTIGFISFILYHYSAGSFRKLI